MLPEDWKDAIKVGESTLCRLSGEDEQQLLSSFQRCMRMPQTANSKFFSGSNPVSVERRHFDLLASNIYWVAEKTDGMRFLMFCTRHNGLKLCLLVDRRHAMFVAPMPMHGACFQGTVLDGELVLNKATGVMQYCVFDAVALCGSFVGALPYSKRMTYLRLCMDAFHLVTWRPGNRQIITYTWVESANASHSPREYLDGSHDMTTVGGPL